MKAIIIGLMAAIFTSFALSAKGADIPENTGFYLMGDLGANIVHDIEFRQIAGQKTPGFNAEVNPGVRGSFGVGYAWRPDLGAELETGFSYNETKTYSTISGGVALNGSARLWVVPLTVGLAWHPTFSPPPPTTELETLTYWEKAFQKLQPFVGGGFGVAEVFGDIDLAPATNPVQSSGHDTVLTYYIKAGLMFPISPKAEFGVQYRFSGNPGFTIKETKAEEIFAHSVGVALRIKF